MVNFNVFPLSTCSLAKVSISLTCHLKVQTIALLQGQRMLAYCYSARSVKFSFSAFFFSICLHPHEPFVHHLKGRSSKQVKLEIVHFEHYTPSSSDLLWEIVEKQNMTFT